MELIRGRHGGQRAQHPCVATIGNFDGVHLGHQSILRQLRSAAARHAVPSTVVMFEPQPAEFLRPDQAPARLSTLREKVELLADFGVSQALVLPFNTLLAALSPRAFVREILIDALAVRGLVIGDNFRFGAKRAGDYDTLRGCAGEFGFELTRAEPFLQEGARVSSTRVRALLNAGEFDAAAALLGRRYQLTGRVVRGAARGRELGFPTINVPLRRRRSPLTGIFASYVHGLRPEPLRGAAYIGARPELYAGREVLEVHLFDYNEECYGARVAVDFVQKIRDAVQFTSCHALREQIAADSARVKQLLAYQT